MGKVTFWGYPNPVDHKYSIAHKYKYVKHFVGSETEKREVYVKIPNVECMKKIIEARKLMSMDFVFRERKAYPAMTNWADFYQTYKQMRKAGISKKFNLVRTKRFINETKDFNRYMSLSMAITDPEKGNDQDLISNLNSKPADYDASGNCENQGQEEVIIRDSTQKNFSGYPDPHSSALPVPSVLSQPADKIPGYNLTHFKEEDSSRSSSKPDDTLKQQLNLVAKIRKFRQSNEVSEILLSNRLASQDSSEAGIFRTSYNIFVDSIRAGVYSHDWSLVSKSVAGLSRELMKGQARQWILWNGGFLALINIYKNEISGVVDFASCVRDIMQSYPPRLKIEVGTWLTQKGYFANAAFLMQTDESKYKSTWNFERTKFKNPKRFGIDYIVALFDAVNQYSCYKRDMQSGIQFSSDEREALHKTGEYTLSLFENLLEMCDLVDSDGTIFMEQLIELLLEFRSKEAAKMVLQKICRKNYGNGVLGEFYLHFLEQNFPHLEREIDRQKRELERMDFTIPLKERTIYNQKFGNFITRRPKRKYPQFKQIPNPMFSW